MTNSLMRKVGNMNEFLLPTSGVKETLFFYRFIRKSVIKSFEVNNTVGDKVV